MITAPALRLAGDILAQFRHLPDDQAVDTVANHIRMFWDPRMRAQLLELATSAGADCDPLVSRVVTSLGD
ncbi:MULTISPECIES: formate dehydrogenase subunit delta [Nocardioides]|uniref:formate dehydrogenase subunit delta n=1 Tax=Nocardioides TaxID=1839 RepID=UPI000404803B|nr:MULTISPECIES: formate dehydrogenase subunit delta [Nocardioides]